MKKESITEKLTNQRYARVIKDTRKGFNTEWIELECEECNAICRYELKEPTYPVVTVCEHARRPVKAQLLKGRILWLIEFQKTVRKGEKKKIRPILLETMPLRPGQGLYEKGARYTIALTVRDSIEEINFVGMALTFKPEMFYSSLQEVLKSSSQKLQNNGRPLIKYEDLEILNTSDVDSLVIREDIKKILENIGNSNREDHAAASLITEKDQKRNKKNVPAENTIPEITFSMKETLKEEHPIFSMEIHYGGGLLYGESCILPLYWDLMMKLANRTNEWTTKNLGKKLKDCKIKTEFYPTEDRSSFNARLNDDVFSRMFIKSVNRDIKEDEQKAKSVNRDIKARKKKVKSNEQSFMTRDITGQYHFLEAPVL